MGAVTQGGQGEFVTLTAGKGRVDSPTRSHLLLGPGCAGQWSSKKHKQEAPLYRFSLMSPAT